MNLVFQPDQGQSESVKIVDNLEGLSAFVQPGCAAAIWRRQAPADVQAWLDAQDPANLPRTRVILQPDAVRDVAAQIFDVAGLPAGPERDWLQADIAGMADMFAGLMDVQYLRMRLDVVSSNACRKFHLDSIKARLVCTYRGTGTQYGAAQKDGDPGTVYTTPTCAPILLRGSLWPAGGDQGILHRSPPIEGTGETRLVLVLDPVFDPQEEAEHEKMLGALH